MDTLTEKTEIQQALVQRYFNEVLPGLVGKLLIPNTEALDVVFEIRLNDPPSQAWCLEVAQGRLTQVGRPGPPAQCVYVLDTATLLEIASNELTPQDAFFALRVDIEGDIEKGLILSTALEFFFQQYPFRG